MREETTKRLDEVSIMPHFGALISTLEELQALFHDLGTEVASRYKLVYPEEAEQLFVAELDNLKKLKTDL